MFPQSKDEVFAFGDNQSWCAINLYVLAVDRQWKRPDWNFLQALNPTLLDFSLDVIVSESTVLLVGIRAQEPKTLIFIGWNAYCCFLG
jgi:hypothetical protein